VTTGELTFLWANQNYYSAWMITQPSVQAHDQAYLEPGTFLFVRGSGEPQDSPALNVLKVDLPMLAEAPIQDFVPQMADYEQPPGETAPGWKKPCWCHVQSQTTWIIRANRLAGCLRLSIVGTSFIRIYYNYNTTNEQTNSVSYFRHYHR
jgi:hypothetical protein